MDQLIEGYRAFRETRWPEQQQLYETLASGQAPRLLVIACCDSRVDPATIFGVKPGEIFVVRNVANLVPPYAQNSPGVHGTSAAIEFAVTRLQVRTVLVLGHARCGGVTAALEEDEGSGGGGFMARWLDLIDRPLRHLARMQTDPQTALERESVRLSLGRLMTFPFVAEAVGEGRLSLEGARFDIADGSLEVLDRATGTFRLVD